ncbi:CvpA family protein [Paenibacillus hamazuiensis]|uniref:CvpA family protein n=1 Tax=Paenibacillus hamazuiensis TaxID=2936508 RepID=UPI00200C9300|nr:CvpA family protein [Paenibacillus hamazuiensis]
MDIIHALNGLDWAIGVAILAGLALGYSRGLISQLISIAGLFIAYLVASKWYGDVGTWIGKWMTQPTGGTYTQYEFLVKGLNLDVYITNAIAFSILFFGTKLALSIIGRLLNLVASVPGIKSLNQTAGALLGFIEAAVLVVVAVNVLTIVPNDQVQRWLKGSYAAPYVVNEAPIVAEKLHEIWKTR